MFTTTDTPRLAARFLMGEGHDVIETPMATWEVVKVVRFDEAPEAMEYGETIAAVVRLVKGVMVADDADVWEWASSSLVERLGADTVFWFRPDDIVAARAA